MIKYIKDDSKKCEIKFLPHWLDYLVFSAFLLSFIFMFNVIDSILAKLVIIILSIVFILRLSRHSVILIDENSIHFTLYLFGTIKFRELNSTHKCNSLVK